MTKKQMKTAAMWLRFWAKGMAGSREWPESPAGLSMKRDYDEMMMLAKNLSDLSKPATQPDLARSRHAKRERRRAKAIKNGRAP